MPYVLADPETDYYHHRNEIMTERLVMAVPDDVIAYLSLEEITSNQPHGLTRV